MNFENEPKDRHAFNFRMRCRSEAKSRRPILTSWNRTNSVIDCNVAMMNVKRLNHTDIGLIEV